MILFYINSQLSLNLLPDQLNFIILSIFTSKFAAPVVTVLHKCSSSMTMMRLLRPSTYNHNQIICLHQMIDINIINPGLLKCNKCNDNQINIIKLGLLICIRVTASYDMISTLCCNNTIYLVLKAKSETYYKMSHSIIIFMF